MLNNNTMGGNQTRRKFLFIGSKLFASVIGVFAFGKYLSLSKWQNTESVKSVKTIVNQEDDRILIAYESRFGSSGEIASFIGENLFDNNLKIDVKRIKDINDLSPYRKIIIGSAIQYDKWMPEARDFIIKNEKDLARKSVSFFLVCLVLTKNNEEATLKADNYASEVNKLAPSIKANSFGKFAGVLDYSKMSFGQRVLAKGLFAIIGVKEGDYRNWDEIRMWANRL